jgi:hypothetical protein
LHTGHFFLKPETIGRIRSLIVNNPFLFLDELAMLIAVIVVEKSDIGANR